MNARAGAPILASVMRVLVVARFTLREALHGRSFIVGGLLSLAWLAVPAAIGWFVFDHLAEFATSFGGGPEAEEFARNAATHIVVGTAIGGLSFIALLVTVFLGSGSVSGEIQRGTILAVIARPLARWELVVGKFLGIVSLAIVLLSLTGGVAVVAAGALTGVWIGDATRAIALLDLNLAVMAALSVAVSTRVSPLIASIAVLATYFGITNLDKLYLFGVLADSAPLREVAVWGRLALPVGEVSDVASRLLEGPLSGLTEGIVRGVMGGFDPRPWIVPYTVAYLAGAVVVGCVGLLRRDLR